MKIGNEIGIPFIAAPLAILLGLMIYSSFSGNYRLMEFSLIGLASVVLVLNIIALVVYAFGR